MHFINQVRLDISIKIFLRVNKENVAFSHLPAQLHYSFAMIWKNHSKANQSYSTYYQPGVLFKI